jgi:hypothetical protein
MLKTLVPEIKPHLTSKEKAFHLKASGWPILEKFFLDEVYDPKEFHFYNEKMATVYKTALAPIFQRVVMKHKVLLIFLRSNAQDLIVTETCLDAIAAADEMVGLSTPVKALLTYNPTVQVSPFKGTSFR